MNTTYRCLECSHEFSGKQKDGLSCPECKGPIMPIGGIVSNRRALIGADPQETIILPKGAVVMPGNRTDYQKLEAKLQYLEELRKLKETRRCLEDFTNFEDRIGLVCDSIEEDLDMRKKNSVAELKATVHVDTSKLEEAIEMIREIGERTEEAGNNISKALSSIEVSVSK